MAAPHPPQRSSPGIDPRIVVKLLEQNLELVDATFRSTVEMLVKERIAALLWQADLFDAEPDREARRWLREQGFKVAVPRVEDEDL